MHFAVTLYYVIISKIRQKSKYCSIVKQARQVTWVQVTANHTGKKD